MVPRKGKPNIIVSSGKQPLTNIDVLSFSLNHVKDTMAESINNI